MMRRGGLSYREIREALGVSKSSRSLWLRDIALTQEHRAVLCERSLEAARRRASTIKARKNANDTRIVREASGQIPSLAESELFVAGVVAYWAEGSKNKPWRKSERVCFANSDPGLVQVFLAWLDLIGIDRGRLAYRISIHERADVVAALRFWSGVVGVPPEHFKKTTLKRHNPRTVRKNVGDEYHGCLTIQVSRSTEFNRRIEGWFKGVVANLPNPIPHTGSSQSGVV